MTQGGVRALAGLVLLTSLTSCSSLTTHQYDATALTRYTWQVDYSPDPMHERGLRFEEFASTTLLNRNGQKPVDAVTGPDDRGLWWAALPPVPSIDEIEQRQQALEKPGPPQLMKKVDYQISFQRGAEIVTLPTNFDVYRAVVKAKRSGAALTLTLGLGDNTVEKAEPP